MWLTLQVASELPKAGVSAAELKHVGVVEVLVHGLSEPHLHTLFTQVLEIDTSHKDVPHVH